MRRSVFAIMPATTTLSGVTLLLQQGGHHASRSLYSRAIRLLRLIPVAMLDLAAPRIVRVHERIASRMRCACEELGHLVERVDTLPPSEVFLDAEGTIVRALADVESHIDDMLAEVANMMTALSPPAGVSPTLRREAMLSAMRQCVDAMGATRLIVRDLGCAILARDADVDAWRRATMRLAGLKVLGEEGMDDEPIGPACGTHADVDKRP